MAKERKRKKAVGDSGGVGRFPLSTIGIEVDPLAVPCDLGKLADALLSDFKPVSGGDFASHEVVEGVEIFECYGRHRNLKAYLYYCQCRSDTPCPTPLTLCCYSSGRRYPRWHLWCSVGRLVASKFQFVSCWFSVLSALEKAGCALTTSYAHGYDAVARVTAFHFVGQRSHEA